MVELLIKLLVELLSGRTTNKVADRATSRATSRAKTIKVWTNAMIILTNLLVYMPKLEKQSKQPRNSSFCSCLTDVIWNVTSARRYLQVFRNLRLASLLFGQVCSAKLFKTFSYIQVYLAAVPGHFKKFLTNNF